MTTLIAVYDSEGCVGRCDARCYNAKGKRCTCVCGGRNHGVGQEQAIENTREWAETMIAEYTEQMGLEEGEFEVYRDPITSGRQLTFLDITGVSI